MFKFFLTFVVFTISSLSAQAATELHRWQYQNVQLDFEFTVAANGDRVDANLVRWSGRLGGIASTALFGTITELSGADGSINAYGYEGVEAKSFASRYGGLLRTYTDYYFQILPNGRAFEYTSTITGESCEGINKLSGKPCTFNTKYFGPDLSRSRYYRGGSWVALGNYSTFSGNLAPIPLPASLPLAIGGLGILAALSLGRRRSPFRTG